MEKGLVNILLVEDEEAHAELVRRALEARRDRFSVAVAGSLAAADRYLKDNEPDLVVCDHVLPDGRGTELVKSWKEAQRFPIILMTAHGDESLAVEVMKAGALDYVVKSEQTFAQMPRLVDRALREWDHIVARKRVQNELSLFQKLIDQSNDAMYITETQSGRILYANEMACRCSGYSHAELIQMHFSDIDLFLPGEEIHQEKIVEHLDRSDFLYFETEHRRKDGGTYPVELSIKTIWQNDRQYSITSARDITERKQAEDSLKRSESRYRMLFNSGSDAVFVHEMPRDKGPGAFVEVNDVACKRLGYSRQRLLTMSPLDIDAPDTYGQVEPVTERLMREGHVLFETIHVAENGSRIPVEINAHLVVQDGKTQVLSFARDISERRGLQDQILQAQKMEAVGRLAGGVAHDFNNLLTIINGYTDLILEQIGRDSGISVELEEIKRAGKRAAALTRQLLAFSRRQVLEPQVVDLSSSVTNLEKMLRRLIGEDIDFRTRLDPEAGSVKVDPGQLEQVIMNLVINARDAMPDGGQLTIQTAPVEVEEDGPDGHLEIDTGSYALLSIEDTGAGMTEQIQKRIFEPFFTTKEKGKGTGLGLSTVYGIIKQSGGDVHVQSEPGQGTTFQVYLPRVDAHDHPDENSRKPAAEQRGSETILVVEDDSAVRGLCSKVLSGSGYKVLVAKGPREALDIVEKSQEPIHLVLSDVVMPDMSGPECAERLRQSRPDMKVMFMTGYTDDSIAHHDLMRPGINMLSKPFTAEDLAAKVRVVLSETNSKN